MKILIVGNGGREHALAWKVKQSPKVEKVFVAPGNAGTAIEPGVENIAIAATDILELLAFAQQEQIGLTIIGPEVPLTMGIVDSFKEAGLPCFGPTAQAAQLEGSKKLLQRLYGQVQHSDRQIPKFYRPKRRNSLYKSPRCAHRGKG